MQLLELLIKHLEKNWVLNDIYLAFSFHKFNI